MKYCFKSIIVLFLLSACQDVAEVEKPDNLIVEEKMVDILVDLAKIDAAMSYNRNEFEKRELVPQTYIFEKYGIDSTQLFKNKAYYIDHPKINKRIFEKVRTRLEKQQLKLDSIAAVKDSLRSIKKKKKISPLGDSTEISKKIYPIDLLEAVEKNKIQGKNAN